MHANKSFNRNPAYHRLYHALMEALMEDENVMDKGVADTVKDYKRKHDDDEDDDDVNPPAGPNQGKRTKKKRTKESESSKKPSSTKDNPKSKALTKGSKTGKSALAKELVEEPIAEVIMDDVGDDVVVLDQPAQPLFNQMVSALKDPLTFNDLMATLIDFSNSNELEYNFQECFNALINKLDWNNPKGDHYPFDLSKPLPLQGPLCHRTFAVDYFFNNVLEYLKTSNPEVILGVKSVSVKKLHGYGHLKEIVVKISDQQLYKFKEGNFVDLHLNDIEDMLLLTVQHKLFHLEGNVDVESYQKKLNITKPQKTFPEIEFKEPYTPLNDPPGIIYEDLDKHKRVMRAEEMYKFSDGTLKSVRDEIHHRVLDFFLDYNKEMQKRKWMVFD
ncbi:hypothetical protein Tco_0255680 [Tanacetum coccineum]